jgi:polyisoprenoid-binding protein YceI
MAHSIIKSLSLVSLFIFSLNAKAYSDTIQVVDLDGSEGSTEFTAIGSPSFLEIHGKGKSPTGQIQIKSGITQGSLIVFIDSFDTGIEKRNEHMKTVYLENKKFPTATLVFRAIQVPKNFTSDGFSNQGFPVSATLTLHGVTNPVSVIADLERKGESLSVHARFKFKLGQYHIKIPSFAGITVADEVQVSVQTLGPIISVK